MLKIILGFDCSSTTVGFGVLSWDTETNDIKLVKMDYIKPIKTGSIIERIANTRDKINGIIQKVKPDYIALEEIVNFMAGKSTAKTIIMLTTFNRMIGLCSFDYLKEAPHMFNVMSIRHGLKLDKVLPAKEEMPDLVAHHLGISFPYELSKKGKRKEENGDKADGCSVALYYAFLLSGRIKPKKQKTKTK